jgi:hypothetical protein
MSDLSMQKDSGDPRAIAMENPSERRADISDTDIRVVRNLGVSMAATVAGSAVAGFVVAMVAVGEAAGPAAPLATTTFRDMDLLRGGVLLIRSMVPNSPSSLARMARTTSNCRAFWL